MTDNLVSAAALALIESTDRETTNAFMKMDQYVEMCIRDRAKPVVAVGDTVLKGQMIAEAGGFVSSPIYSSVSGKVKGRKY